MAAAWHTLLAAPPALAQEPVAPPEAATADRYELGEIAVGKKRAAPPATEQRVDEAQIAPQAARTTNELMRLVPGAHVPMNSRGEQFVFLRDAGERQVAVFLDGAQLTVPWDYAVDLGMVPAGLIGAMTVVKGASSVLWGANVIGGAVNLLTREQRGDGQTTDVAVWGGWPARWAAQANHVGRSGRWSWAAGAQAGGNGEQPLAEGALTNPRAAPYSNNTFKDLRNNSSGQNLGAMLRGQYLGDGGERFAVTALHMDAEKGAPPQGNLDPDQNS
ncbi:MAG: Plug domain-containing protein, partial [Deltaproteobacteria bacterium]|nr:Plug domain-containing protein [Deltaproteobacteria bacterium]